jgi:hypothetical protein
MKRTYGGYILFSIACIALLANYYFITAVAISDIIYFSSTLVIAGSLLLIFPFDQIIFDNHEWSSNKTLPALIVKIRLRAVLFNNISVIIFIMAIMVIIAGFYILIHPQVGMKNGGSSTDLITLRISSTALLIFLVQVLFRAFKYLLRVAAFYNGKADAMEANELIPKSDLAILMGLFTPDKYDISDVSSPALFDKLPGIK